MNKALELSCNESEWCKLLEQGVASLQLNLTSHQSKQLNQYLELLMKWNAVYNLTSIRNPLEMVKQHLLDSLAVVSAFSCAERILDVGSGGGLPGIVLAIIYPNKNIVLIDIVHKKTAFLKQVVAELQLANVMVYTGRVEQLRVDTLFDVITARAFSELTNLVRWAEHLLTPSGQFIALKGHLPQQEIDALPISWKTTKIEPIQVPNLLAQRHLIYLERS